MTSTQGNMCPSPFDNKDTQTEIETAEKKDIDPISTKHQSLMTRDNKSIIVLQKVAATSLDNPTNIREMNYFSRSGMFETSSVYVC